MSAALRFPGVAAVGEVTSVEGATLVVNTPSGPRHAREAAGGLVAPRAGDVVQLATTPRGVYVVAVLERSGGGAEIVLPEGAAVRAEGRVTVAAEEIALESQHGDSHVIAHTLSVVADRGALCLQALAARVGAVRSVVDRAELVARDVAQIAGRLSVRVRRSSRTTTEHDRTSAEQVHIRVRRLVSLGCEHAVLTANQLVRIDGTQVQIG